MKILFLTTAFNGMAQRLWIELDRLNHPVYVQLATSGEAMEEAVMKFKPHLIIAPYLKSKIPASIYEHYNCLIVHPGIIGDRGASSLDWAILSGEKNWGVTILQAVEKMDAGPIWSFQPFQMRAVSKGQLYRNEVTQAAAKGILDALEKIENKAYLPLAIEAFNHQRKGRWNNKVKQIDFAFDWTDKTSDILIKIRAADSDPGVLIPLLGEQYYAFGGHREGLLTGEVGTILGQRNQAICVATSDGAIWLTHLKPSAEKAIKLPSILVLGDNANDIKKRPLTPSDTPTYPTWQEIKCVQQGDIAYLHFDFYNGAMSTDQCLRLREALIKIKQTDARIIVLMGGEDVWSNGIHLNVIEAAENPADESWANINAIDDLILEIITSTDHYIIAALQGNAGAGGVSLALAADKVLARDGIVINPHTKNMGLYGSEYWTFLLPKRIGTKKATQFTEECLPWGVHVAKEIGLIDDYHGQTNTEFVGFVQQEAQNIAQLSYFDKLLKAKKFQRLKDERNKPLARYRAEELEKMKANFYDNNHDYAFKRYCFVHKMANNKLTEDLFSSRRKIYRKRKWESIEYNE